MNKLLCNIRQGAFRSNNYLDVLFKNDLPILTIVPSRTKYYHNRHRDPKYRKERARKVWKIKLPDFDKDRGDEDLTPDQIRAKFKEKGIAPPTPWNEREIYNPCTITLIDPFVPAEGDGKFSLIDKLKSPISSGKSLIKSRRALSSARMYEGEDFSLEEFAKQSTSIYIKAHQALASKDEKKVFDYVTEHCFPKMTSGLNSSTIVWKYSGDVEAPAVVQIRCGDLVTKGDNFCQITVRMHTKQMLEIYDRHGRLIHGGANEVKNVFEYIVFEKCLANEYGQWRIHDRIRPPDDNVSFTSQISKTFVINKTK